MPRHNFEALRGRLVHITIDSRALRGNLLGDPRVRQVPVYLPEGYDEGERYPLFVDLVGFSGSGFSHLSWKPFGESVPQRLDRLRAEGRMGPVVAAFPDCFTSLGGNQYINSLAMGRWEDFLIDEMIPALESQLRLRPGRAHRAVFGKSSGGYGAIAHGLRRADAWNAIACHSGDMAFDWVYKVELIKTLEVLSDHDRSVERFLLHLERAPKIRSGELHALMILAMAATYDPDPAAYKGVRLPLDRETGAIDEDAWARWMVHDPVVMIERPECAESLRRLAGVWIDCGKRDQYLLHYGSRQLVRRLRALDIPHRYEEFDDDHTSVDYRMDGSLPFLYAALTGALAAT